MHFAEPISTTLSAPPAGISARPDETVSQKLGFRALAGDSKALRGLFGIGRAACRGMAAEPEWIEEIVADVLRRFAGLDETAARALEAEKGLLQHIASRVRFRVLDRFEALVSPTAQIPLELD
ncbi:MAG: hypothetical protein WA823_03180 [Candidatus Acidiferrales bacterium]